MKSKPILLTLIVLAFSGTFAFAQDEESPAAGGDEQEGARKYNTWSAGINVGHALNFGDLKQYDYAPVFKFQDENGFGVGAVLGKALSNAFTLRGTFNYYSLKGTKRGPRWRSDSLSIAASDYTGHIRYLQGVYMETNVIEGTLQLIFNVSNLAFSGKVGKDRKMAFYLFAGHGLVSFDTKIYSLMTDDEIELTEEAKVSAIPVGGWGRTTEAVTPVGFGLKWKLSQKLDLTFEANAKRVNSDKLDGMVGGTNDYFNYTSLGLVYKFGKAGPEGESIEWVNPLDAMNNDIHKNRVRLNTLQSDQDGDGVSDFFDKDSSTPEGVNVDGGGVGLDVDMDGVPNSSDEDNFTPRGATVNETGVAIDSDGDGVPDALDLEPNTEKGKFVNFQGKTIEVEASGGGGAYFPTIHFALNSANVTNNQYDKIATIARALKENAKVKVTLVGHTDPSGSEEYNMTLGTRRAQSVADHLSKYYGMGAERAMVESKGEAEIAADGLNAMNRRVEISIK